MRAMASPSHSHLACAQLMRLPNVFTAVADPLAGWLVVGGGAPAWHLVALAVASASLYTSGIVFNDVFDYRRDCRERPERPLPRGAVSVRVAGILGAGLLLAGLAFAALAGNVAFGVALFIAAMVFFYNAWARRFARLGPLALGACRFANFLLGMRCCPPRLWIAPAALGLYVTALSFVAAREVEHPGLRATVKRLLLGIILIDAVAVVALRGDWIGAALVLTLLVPAIALSKLLPMT
jgi:4-hydroxybenzoate polyprenyltransferase